MRLLRWLICAGFAAAALVLALLPFVVVSDPAEAVPPLTWSGYSLIVGAPGPLHLEADALERLHRIPPAPTDPERAAFLERFGNAVDPPVRPQPVLMSAALFIVAGFAGALLLSAGARPPVFAVAGLGGAVTLVVAEIRAMNRLSVTPVYGMGPPTPAYGFWIAAALLLALGITGTAMTARQIRRTAPTGPGPAVEVGPTTG
jgi:hypothetical protein